MYCYIKYIVDKGSPQARIENFVKNGLTKAISQLVTQLASHQLTHHACILTHGQLIIMGINLSGMGTSPP